MADYLIHDSTLEDIADAIRSKTGGSSLIAPEDMPTEIASISGGGSLPSSISKISGGSFTLSSDTTASKYSITHDMGVTPIGFVIWCNTLDVTTAINGVIVRFNFLESLYNNNYLTAQQYQVTTRNSATNLYSASISESSVGGFVSSTFINAKISNIAYLAGHEYKWLAWA